MDCKKFELLILDYIDGELDAELSEVCSDHLKHCPNCSALNEDYKSIRNDINKSEKEAPPAHVLEAVRQYGKEHGIIKEKPFYKKLFNSNILVPTFAAAVTLILVLSYGQEYMNKQSITGEMSSLSDIAGKVDGKSVGKEGLIAGVRKDNQSTETVEVPGSPETPRGELLYSQKEPFAKKGEADSINNDDTPSSMSYSEGEKSSSPGFAENGITEHRSQAEETETGDEYTYFKRQLNRVTLLQYQGQCSKSIMEAEKLLKSDPPLSIRKDAYSSQAECYEETGQYARAIEVYKKLKEAEISLNGHISSKIKELEHKLNK